MELNVKFGFERNIAVQGLKKKIRVKVLKSDLTVLRELGQKLKAVQKTIFRSRYGNLGIARSRGAGTCHYCPGSVL